MAYAQFGGDLGARAAVVAVALAEVVADVGEAQGAGAIVERFLRDGPVLSGCHWGAG